MTLRELREKRGMSPEEAAYKLRISLSTLRNWETGKNEPTLTPKAMANALSVYDCTFEEFRQAVQETVEQVKRTG